MPETKRVIEPTDEEKRNGWDAETLTDYLEEAEKRQLSNVFTPPQKPHSQNHKYNPLRWRA
jgi:hypothetical protein